MQRIHFLQTLAILVGSALLPMVVVAAPPKVSIAVNHTGDDSVGQTLAFAIREAIRGSHGYELVAGAKAAFRISIVTLDPDKSGQVPGSRTIAAMTFTARNTNLFNDRWPQTWYPIYLTTEISMTGAGRVDDQAKSILASLEAEIENYRKDQSGR